MAGGVQNLHGNRPARGNKKSHKSKMAGVAGLEPVFCHSCRFVKTGFQYHFNWGFFVFFQILTRIEMKRNENYLSGIVRKFIQIQHFAH